jgi:hypothetical protein
MWQAMMGSSGHSPQPANRAVSSSVDRASGKLARSHQSEGVRVWVEIEWKQVYDTIHGSLWERGARR